MIQARGLRFSYGARPVLHDVSLATRGGEVLGIIGPNGSGKSTLLGVLGGSLNPSAGEVTVDGRTLSDLRPKERARRMAVVIQEAEPALGLSAAEVVLLGRNPHLGDFQRPGTIDERAAATALGEVGLADRAGCSLSELSGGERQRVAIARALAAQAPHLLFDEPTNHLDVRYQHEVLALIRRSEATVVVSLHDLNLAARYCDRLVLLHHGEAVAQGAPEEVLEPGLIGEVYGLRVHRVAVGGVVQLLFELQ
ncbi:MULTISPECIES: ABC transporter ATP-binding protein [unclassified Corynebacterium]|uniref:ABC transporter ATP-binding protein n=1 Tax=unclassified Corynebacterium TaxID=2624378 RepID=UPI0029C9C891|nr:MULTISPECIES: ABC transporter ATP-binding protein [unclassified Corynebacterium]WPF66412.1 ABC transporter ATP-binding protein [Corynebacterium sp. 22KM0430]WPF68902.1 ABC transporter ATP-binding protein [Corynebacterium sp. 21KM1197]